MSSLYRDTSVEFTEGLTKEIKFTYVANIEREKLFNVITSVKDYSEIFADNYGFVDIMKSDRTSDISKRSREGKYLKKEFLVKHTVFPYEKH